MSKVVIGADLSIHYDKPTIRKGKSITCRSGASPAFPLPDDAPQEVKDFAALHWTPEVIQFAKDKIAGVKPKE
jgi:hypothetical protein